MKTSRLFAYGIAALLLAAMPAFAATWTWDGGSGNDHWTNSPNWNPDTTPANDGTADVIFAGTTRLTPDMNANWSVNSVTFNNTASTFFLSSTTNSTLTVGAGGISDNSSFNQTINHSITLGAAQTWNLAAGAGTLNFNGAVNNGGNLLTADTASASNLYFFGTLSGSGGLTKNGMGLAALRSSASNTYSGTTTVNAGTLELRLGSTVAVAIPGQLDIGDGVGAGIDTVTDFMSNQIAVGATVSVFSSGTLGLTGSTSEAFANLNIVSSGIVGGGLVTIGDGTLTILGNMTLTGGTVTTSGTGKLLLNGTVDTIGSSMAANINSKLDLGNGTRTFTIDDGAALNDLDVTGVMSNGAIIKDGPGTLRLGAANTYAGGTTLNAGTILIGNNAALGTGPVTGNGGTLQADGAARTIANALNGSFAVDGVFDITLNSPLNLTGGITKNGVGTLIFAQAGAITDSLTVNAGTVRVDVPVTFSGGLTNSATVLFGTQTLTVNGAGLDNEGSLPLAGGTLVGSGPVVNNGLISGYGTIGGTGGFTNNAQLTLSGGSVTLANAGPNANAGNVSVPSGLQLRLTGGTLANTGFVDLAGGIVTGTATLSNNTGGTVSGRGTISAPLANAGGTLRAIGGTMNVTNAFTNSGVIRLDDAAGLAGGTITNTGRIQGDGSIANPLTNAAGGSIRADVGKTLFFTGAFAPNAGELNLQGGTLDFDSAVTNSATGFIAGRGALYTGGLTNSGAMAFSGGTADIHGDVTNNTAGKIIGANSTTTFFDDVVNDGEIRASQGSFAVFFGSVTGGGSYTGPGVFLLEGDLNAASVALPEGLMHVNGSASSAASITGGGELSIGDGLMPGRLTAGSIMIDTLTIVSGATVTIQTMPGGPQGRTIAPVPEPSTFVILGMAMLSMFAYAWRRRKQ